MLQQARLLSRLTQRELAKRLGTTQRYIRELEAGKPSIAMSRLFTALVESNMTMTMTIAMEDDRNG
jgi:HTH-type transcriptional regulator/antitoxin HipB